MRLLKIALWVIGLIPAIGVLIMTGGATPTPSRSDTLFALLLIGPIILVAIATAPWFAKWPPWLRRVILAIGVLWWLWSVNPTPGFGGGADLFFLACTAASVIVLIVSAAIKPAPASAASPESQ